MQKRLANGLATERAKKMEMKLRRPRAVEVVGFEVYNPAIVGDRGTNSNVHG